MSEHFTGELWITLLAVAVIATPLIIVVAQQRRLNDALKAILGSVERPVLFYDQKDNLVYCSPGLILFDPQERKKLGRPPAHPLPGQTVAGELIIDFNRYRYLAKLLEYKPGRYGVLVQLDYQGSVDKGIN